MKKTWIMQCVAFSALIMVTGCKDLFTKKQAVEQKAEPIKLTVQAEPAAIRTLEKKELFTGVLEPLKKADLAPAMPGLVRSIPVQIGQYVKAGQVLASMDDVTLVSTRAQFEPLKAQYERSKRLYESNALSKAQFEGVEAQYLATKRQLTQIEENTTITAPFSGVITAKAVEEGEIYSTMPGMGGPKGLIQLVQLDPLKVDFKVDEKTIRHVKKGMKVALTIDALSETDTTVAGTVQWVNPAADPMSRTFEVRITVPNRNGLLRAGYFVKMAVIAESKKEVLAVPVNALIGDRIFVIDNTKRAIARVVSRGWETAEYVEILSGIAENELVVVAGNKALPDSSEVIIEAK